MSLNDFPALPKDWFATYVKLTARSVLAYEGISVSPEMLVTQLAEHDSFYAGLVRLPALVTFNSLFNGQCRNIQTYCQERLIEYILSGVDQKMNSESQVALKDKIEETRLSLIALGERLSDLEARHYELMSSVFSFQEEQVAKWHEAVQKFGTKLWDAITRCQPEISFNFKERLIELMKTQAPGVILPEAIVRLLNIKNQPSATQVATIQTYIEAEILKTTPLSNPPECLKTTITESTEVENELQVLQKALESERKAKFLSEIQSFQRQYSGENSIRSEWDKMRETIDDELYQVKPEAEAFPAEQDTKEMLINQQPLRAPIGA